MTKTVWMTPKYVIVQWKSAQPSISKNIFRCYVTGLKWLGALWEFNLRPFRSPCPHATRSSVVLFWPGMETIASLGGAHLSPEASILITVTSLTVVLLKFPGGRDEFDPPVGTKVPAGLVVVWDWIRLSHVKRSLDPAGFGCLSHRPPATSHKPGRLYAASITALLHEKSQF